jgi:hypothetical protein
MNSDKDYPNKVIDITIKITFDEKLKEGVQTKKYEEDEYDIYVYYNYKPSPISDLNTSQIRSIRIDEKGDYEGSGHAVSGPKNKTINLKNKYGRDFIDAKDNNVIIITIDTEKFEIEKIIINNVNYFASSELDETYFSQNFKEESTEKGGRKSRRNKTDKKTKKSKTKKYKLRKTRRIY